ncbi:MAG TPA: M28 family peptidase, partial [Gemmataceae bacterium]|nr:M28 family peptidase [Gemmataceae bacterium]
MPEGVDEYGWPVSAHEEAIELRPGLHHIAKQIVKAIIHLGCGENAHCIAKAKLTDNPFWPATLAERAGNLPHERFVTLLSLALSRSQDDKGRVRWTLFGGSEQGPGKAFWKSFWTAPRKELPEDDALAHIRRILCRAYEVPPDHINNFSDLRGIGFRILPDDTPLLANWRVDKLPTWANALIWTENEPVESIKYLLTFKPFASLPEPIQSAYLSGQLHLLPCPGSLLGWGVKSYVDLSKEFPFAMQIPLQNLVARHEAWPGMRVPQSGWLHEPRQGKEEPDHVHGPVRNTYVRTHRWAKLHRYDDELGVNAKEDKLAHVLFSTDAHDMGLYGKPMGRNSQIWTHDFHLLLEGPHAKSKELARACHTLKQGGMFGYRLQFPPMRVGLHELFWHRPLVAYQCPNSKEPRVLVDAPMGYLTAYPTHEPDLQRPLELWPRPDHDEAHLAAAFLFNSTQGDRHPKQTTINARKILDSWHLFGKRPLSRSFVHQFLTLHHEETVDRWLESLAKKAEDAATHNHVVLPEAFVARTADAGKKLTASLNRCLEPVSPNETPVPAPLTYHHTAKRSFEVDYWKLIAKLAEGEYRNKDNADCVRDPITQHELTHHERDLEALGDYILDYYKKLIAAQGMKGKALAGELPFHWRTDFDFSWMGGWLHNQQGHARERNLMVVIPGRDRKRAVIMGDHYDTAYMLDCYDPQYGGNGARIAACGADDNHSATAALMLGAPVFMELSKAGKLDCDIWLIHLTGEEFPSDCLGARNLSQHLVEGNLKLHLPKGETKDLSKTRVQGVYVLDMVAHNNDNEPDIFQISPGAGAASLWLAYQAHMANQIWNANAPTWNQKPPRREKTRGKRSADSRKVPATALHPVLSGEVRLPYDPRSTLYNTDGQIFSDTGVP